MTTMRQLRKANNKLDKQLSRENKGILTDITLYLRYSDIYDERIEEIRQDLLYMFLDAQSKDVPIQSYIGEDYKAFCDEIIENSPRKTKIERVMELVEIITTQCLVLTIVLFLFEVNITKLFSSFYLPKQIFVSVYMILYYIVIILVSFYIHRSSTKYALSHKDENRNNVRSKFAFISAISVCVIVIVLSLTLRTMKFSVSTMYILLGIFLCMFIALTLHMVSNYVRHKHIQMTKTLS